MARTLATILTAALLAACEPPEPLPEGEATQPPRGYEPFCERNPDSPLC